MKYNNYSKLIDQLNRIQEKSNNNYFSSSIFKYSKEDRHLGEFCWKIQLNQILEGKFGYTKEALRIYNLNILLDDE